MRKRTTYKEYLNEYYRYFQSFSEVIDKEDDGLTVSDDEDTKVSRNVRDDERDCEEEVRGDDKENLDPCKFRQWMEISIAGEN